MRQKQLGQLPSPDRLVHTARQQAGLGEPPEGRLHLRYKMDALAIERGFIRVADPVVGRKLRRCHLFCEIEDGIERITGVGGERAR